MTRARCGTDGATARAASQMNARSLRPERSVESRRTAAITLGSNATIAIAKIVAGVLSGSAAMFAEAARSPSPPTRPSC